MDISPRADIRVHRQNAPGTGQRSGRPFQLSIPSCQFQTFHRTRCGSELSFLYSYFLRFLCLKFEFLSVFFVTAMAMT